MRLGVTAALRRRHTLMAFFPARWRRTSAAYINASAHSNTRVFINAGVMAVAQGEGHADARRHHARLAGPQLDGLLHGTQHTLKMRWHSDSACNCVSTSTNSSPQPCHGVLAPHAVLQALPNDLQQTIAGGVARSGR